MRLPLITIACLAAATAIAPGCNAMATPERDQVTANPSDPAQPDIVTIAAGNPAFSTLVAALKQADLVAALQGDGPFTVLAPTDDAFAALPAGTLESLSTQQLTTILKHHVIVGAVDSGAVSGLTKATSLAGQTLVIDASDGVRISGATVTTADIAANNGVIHVIDRVILPPDGDVVATAVAADGFTTLTGAVTSAGLVPALQGEGPFTVFAPSDEAFAALPDGTLESLSEQQLTAILKLHVVPGLIVSGDAAAAVGGEVPTLNGTPLAVATNPSGELTVGGARVIATDVLATNGVIHVIDRVILP